MTTQHPGAPATVLRQLLKRGARLALPPIARLSDDRARHAARVLELTQALDASEVALTRAREELVAVVSTEEPTVDGSEPPAAAPDGQSKQALAAAHQRSVLRAAWGSRGHELAGISFDVHDQLARAAELSVFTSDLPWDEPGETHYNFGNREFHAADAIILTALLRSRSPRRVVSVGGSSALPALLDIRTRWLPELELVVVGGETQGVSADVTTIDGPLIDSVATVTRLVEPGDVVLIDTDRIVSSASDVSVLFAELLPRLAGDVVVGVPDIFSDFEYPDGWLNENRQWTLAHLVRAYLSGNAATHVIYASDWLTTWFRPELALRLPRIAELPASYLWFETTARLAPAFDGPPRDSAAPVTTATAETGPEPGTTAAELPRSAKVPQRLIEWDGERCVPWTDDLQVIYEHYQRYLLAVSVLAAAGGDREVLDLASGEGYGSALLAGAGHRVNGIDLSGAAVRHAKAKYARTGLAFRQGSMLDLSAFADSSIGAITCFEALEHVTEHDQLMAEIDRVLSPDGLLFISSPDRTVYTDEHHNDNPFHVKELSRPEFLEFLGKSYDHVAVWGQTVAVGSLMEPYEGAPADGPGVIQTLASVPAEDAWTEVPAPAATYLVAVASAVPLPALPGVVALVDRDFTLVRQTMRERDQARVGG